jgi:uncharacterized membrane protein YhaH (DUF805 family)
MEWMLMPLKRYADFSGRSRRMEYWMFVLFQFLVTIVINVVMMIVGGTTVMAAGNAPGAILAAGGAFMIFGLVYLLFWLAMLIPSVAVGVRRLHDTGRSGWWMLAPLAGYGIASQNSR